MSERTIRDVIEHMTPAKYKAMCILVGMYREIHDGGLPEYAKKKAANTIRQEMSHGYYDESIIAYWIYRTMSPDEAAVTEYICQKALTDD